MRTAKKKTRETSVRERWSPFKWGGGGRGLNWWEIMRSRRKKKGGHLVMVGKKKRKEQPSSTRNIIAQEEEKEKARKGKSRRGSSDVFKDPLGRMSVGAEEKKKEKERICEGLWWEPRERGREEEGPFPLPSPLLRLPNKKVDENFSSERLWRGGWGDGYERAKFIEENAKIRRRNFWSVCKISRSETWEEKEKMESAFRRRRPSNTSSSLSFLFCPNGLPKGDFRDIGASHPFALFR